MEHSMSQYVNKDEMLKAVMAENEQLRAQLAATQQGVQPDVRACIRAELENWHIESGDVSHYEALTDSLVSALKRTTHPTTHGLDAPNERGWVCQHPQYGRWFISRKSILEDLNTYRKEVGGEAATLDCESVDIWWAEQCGWPEIAAYGKQLSRHDMDAQEKEFLNLMKRDTKNVSFHFEQEEIQVTK